MPIASVRFRFDCVTQHLVLLFECDMALIASQISAGFLVSTSTKNGYENRSIHATLDIATARLPIRSAMRADIKMLAASTPLAINNPTRGTILGTPSRPVRYEGVKALTI